VVILTVTLNLAIDVTYYVERVQVGATAAVDAVSRRAGGKGVNVARTLKALGRKVVVTGFAGGPTGAAARAELGDSGLNDETVLIGGNSRTTLVVVDNEGEATGFSEPGPDVSSEEWKRLRARFEVLVAQSEAVVLAGSLPPGVPRDAYAQLVSCAVCIGVPVLLDSHGEALVTGVGAGPDVVKINRDELAGAVGLLGDGVGALREAQALGGTEPSVGADASHGTQASSGANAFCATDGAGGPEVLAGACSLRTRGAGAVAITDGAEGILGVTGEGAWHAKPPERLQGNPTGAGDAASAGLIASLLDGAAWPECLVEAAALSAAAVCAPLAGSFDDGVYRRLRREIVAARVDVGC
jgi:tagatose 6-phosphate kinase